MARINIEDDIESHKEFRKLLKLCGGDWDQAMGKLVRFFREAQRAYKNGRPLDGQDLEGDGLGVMIESGWAVPHESGYQVTKPEEHFAWIAQKIEAGRRGGIASGAKRALVAAKRDEASVKRSSSETNPPAPAPAPAPAHKTKTTALSAHADALPKLAKIWNENRGTLPSVAGCNSTRTRLADARWKEKPDEGFWVGLVQRIARSPFCRGDGPRGWRADFDFFIRPETQHKVLEGKYDAHSASATAPRSAEAEAADREQAEIDKAYAAERLRIQREIDGDDNEVAS